jgi:threonine aldolase
MADSIVPGAQFASDTTAGVHPAAWAALQEANSGRSPGYGGDRWTAAAKQRLCELFHCDAAIYFLSSGTAANALVIAQLCRTYEAVVCHDLSHLMTDECGAPGYLAGGVSLLGTEGVAGRMTAAGVTQAAHRRRDVHAPLARMVSLTQTTEAGTLYSIPMIQAIGEAARAADLYFHMDGARFANAAAQLDANLAEWTWKAGVDVLCFGGTKNGMPMSEAILFFNTRLANGFERRLKQSGHLPAKSRFLAAPWLGMLAEDRWLQAATHANAMARQLEQFVRRSPGAELLYPVEANAVFVRLAPQVAQRLQQRGWITYTVAGGTRLMCSWATTPEEVQALGADLLG